MKGENPEYDVLIVGGGVTGTALLYTLSKYTDIRKIGLIEKYSDFGLVNSASTKNSQTLHFGDIETNYTFEKAKSVKQNAELVMRYIENEKKINSEPKIFSKYSKMVLAVGRKQVDELSDRFKKINRLFPGLKEIGRDEIAKIEPRIVEGRPEDQEILALLTEDGYSVDFKRLSHSFVNNAIKAKPDISTYLNTRLVKIIRGDKLYIIRTDKGDIKAEVVVVAAGGHSLLIAKSLGYGNNMSILSVAGSFYTASNVLNGKVYTMQIEKLPFAAIHGDPEVHNEKITRFGPTAKPIFLLERHNRSTFLEYWRTFGSGLAPIASLLSILSDKILFKYVFMNFLYDLPWIGKRMFIKEIRMIVPGISLSEIRFARRIGGTRPQIINTITRKLEMGEAKLTGDNIIFNITPSPGASTCLGNAYTDALKIIEFFGNKFRFNREAFEKDLR